MIQNITELRNGITPAQEYFWMLPENEDGSYCHTCINWPLPEDFSYNNDLSNISSHGMQLGDLNWFPADKATWQANRDMLLNEIIWSWPDPHPIVVWQAEAEDGYIEGDAAIDLIEAARNLSGLCYRRSIWHY
jgi:hypothetical protein